MEIAKLLSSDLNEGFHNYRMIEPEQVNKMVLSLSSVGQLHPIVVQKTENSYNIIDGVKRFRASVILEIEDCDVPRQSMGTRVNQGFVRFTHPTFIAN